MSIHYREESGIITINTLHTSYQMRVDSHGFLQHLYYGKTIRNEDMSYLYPFYNRGFSGNPEEVYPDNKISFDTMPQEYTGYGNGDYRINSIAVQNADGSCGADFRYVTHSVRRGKYGLCGMPASYGDENEAETLSVLLCDPVTKLQAELLYGVFENKDIIARAVRITNGARSEVVLNKALSISLDIPFGRWDFIHFHGKHTLERQIEREPLTHLVKTVESKRGTSSHQENPFVILCDRRADEEHGSCYGFMLVYSGSFRADAELDQFDSTRIVMGIQDDQFAWRLGPGETFETPEVLMAFTDEGLTALSHRYHKIIRHNICRGKYQFAKRPVLINNWEATYFDFTDEKILAIAEEAAKLNIEMLVLDDGWFGERDSDKRGLGDWFENRKKIKCGLRGLAEEINKKGLKFGIWMERVTANFPDLLVEGCSGGGGRFDAGILYYSPQIWCSDDTDPIERLNIQYGTSFGYPVSTMGAHVSASPNHQTGRTTPFHTRGVTAMSGTFGYELDPGKLTEEEKAEVREQIRIFKEHYSLIQGGLHYRLTQIDEEPYEAWEFAAEDRSEALLNVVLTRIQPNAALINIRMKGLDPEGIYELKDESQGQQKLVPSGIPYPEWRKVFSGAMLMNGGYTLPYVTGDYPAFQIYFRKKQNGK